MYSTWVTKIEEEYASLEFSILGKGPSMWLMLEILLQEALVLFCGLFQMSLRSFGPERGKQLQHRLMGTCHDTYEDAPTIHFSSAGQ